MLKKLNFVTLSPECRNIELVKDVGQIPYILGAEHGDVISCIVASCIDSEGTNLDCVPGLRIIHVPLAFGSSELTGVFFILRHAKKIDWLNIHHAGRRSYYWTKLYKFLNPRGKVYLKLDMDFRSCNMYDSDNWERNIFKKNMEVADLVSVETQAVKDRIQKYSDQDIKVLGNGYCRTEFDVDVRRKRENCFITVGRLGTKQKATEILLESFAQSASSHDWKIKLIGTIEEEFEDYIKSFWEKYPELKERVFFLGEIKERQKLYDEYCRAKVFVLPSRWEGFVIAGCEALSFGCRMIVSDQVPSMKEMTCNGRYGEIVPVDDIDELEKAMVNATRTEFSQEEIQEIQEYANARFSWSLICDQLYDMLRRN